MSVKVIAKLSTSVCSLCGQYTKLVRKKITILYRVADDREWNHHHAVQVCT